MKIIVTKRTEDYHACLEGNSGYWGAGKSIDEAIGDLIQAHKEIFNLEIDLSGLPNPN